MSQARQSGPRVPEVNLFAPPRRIVSTPIAAQSVELVLVVLVVIVWVAVGVGIALLFGWRPPVGLGT